MKRSPVVTHPTRLADAVSADAPPHRSLSAQRIVSRPSFWIRHAVQVSCEFEPHSHPALILTALMSGKMSVMIGNVSLELAAGDIAFTNAGETHSGRATEAEFVSIGLSAALVNQLVNEIGLIRTSAEIVFKSPFAKDEAIIALVRTILTEISGLKPGAGQMLDAMARQLSIQLLRTELTVRKSAAIELSRAGPVDRRLRRAIEFIHDNFDRELSLEEIASAAYLSEYHFARLFKQITGVTPHLYLANLRLERARKLLVETVLPVSQIAAMVGHQSQSHFTKVFKSVTGLTPRIYREAAAAEMSGDQEETDSPIEPANGLLD